VSKTEREAAFKTVAEERLKVITAEGHKIPWSRFSRLRRWSLEYEAYGWRWRHDRELNLLVTEAGGFLYEVDMDRVTTRGDVAFWLHHLSGKRWADNDLLGQFLRAAECVGGIDWYTGGTPGVAPRTSAVVTSRRVK
jgi:hypothetical protein